MFFTLVYVTAGAYLSWRVCHLSQSNKSVLTGFLSRCMQYWLNNYWPCRLCSNTKSHNGWKRLSLSVWSPCIPTVFLTQKSWVIIMFCC